MAWIPDNFLNTDVTVHLKMMFKDEKGNSQHMPIPGKIVLATPENSFVLQLRNPATNQVVNVLEFRENIHDIAMAASVSIESEMPSKVTLG